MEPAQEKNKQTQARKLIERYFFQLTVGCGRSDCKNNYCASSGLLGQLSGNQAAIKSLQLYVEQARLCAINSSSTSAASLGVIKDIEMTELPVKRFEDSFVRNHSVTMENFLF